MNIETVQWQGGALVQGIRVKGFIFLMVGGDCWSVPDRSLSWTPGDTMGRPGIPCSYQQVNQLTQCCSKVHSDLQGANICFYIVIGQIKQLQSALSSNHNAELHASTPSILATQHLSSISPHSGRIMEN